MDLIAIHLATLSLTAIAILYADHMGYQYFTGKRLHLNHERTVILHRIVWVGLIGMIVSGYLIAAPQWDYLRSEPVFFVKLGLVLVLVMNALVIGKMAHLTSDRAFAELPADVRRAFMISGALSAIGWIGAAVIGYFYL